MRLFSAAKTQLRFHFGGAAGFDYPAVEWVARKLGIKIDAAMLAKLQAIEYAYVDELNKTDEKPKP